MPEESFSARLRRLIGKRPLTQVADAAGLSRPYLSETLLKGRTKRPSADTIDALARALGVTSEYLRTGRDIDEDEIDSLQALLGWRNKYHQQEWRHIQRVVEQATRRPRLQAVAESREPYGLRRLPVIHMSQADIQRLTIGRVAAGQPIVIVSDDYPADYVYASSTYTTFSDEQEPSD